jgi:trans-aconitate methyltransferase
MNTFMGRRRRRESMSLRSATDLFSEWADVGRDEGMERGHSASVEVMLKELLEGWNRPFRAMDIGCGNGWVVRRLSAHALCSHASGVDGAPSMIAKARTIDPDGDYIEAMLPEWTPGAPYDLVHTMECLYYLEDPLGFLQTLHDEWMLPGGRLVIGVDHYTENPASHDWGPSLNVHMALLSMDDWTSGLKEAGFTDITAMQVGAKEDWAGTLVLTANRRDG